MAVRAQDLDIRDLEAEEFISLIDNVLKGSNKTFGIEDGSIILEWHTSDQQRLAKVKELFQQYGLKHGVYYSGVVIQMTATTGRHGAARLTLV